MRKLYSRECTKYSVGTRLSWVSNGSTIRGTVVHTKLVQNTKFPKVFYEIKLDYSGRTITIYDNILPEQLSKVGDTFDGYTLMCIKFHPELSTHYVDCSAFFVFTLENEETGDMTEVTKTVLTVEPTVSNMNLF